MTTALADSMDVYRADSDRLDLAVRILGNPSSVTPLMLPAPDRQVAMVVHALSEGNRTVADGMLADKSTAAAFAAYREQLTWTEAVNSRRLELLAWAWKAAKRASAEDGDVGDQTARGLERIAVEAWNLDGLSTERGWAERTCRSRLLSSAARLLAV